MASHKVIMVIAYYGYQPIEYEIPKKILLRAGFNVITASNKPGSATAKDKSTAKVDLTLDQVAIQSYKAIIFVGGSGALDNLDNQTSYQLLTQSVALGILIGAICIAPRILAHAGILTDVAATGWDDDNQLASIFDEHGVNYIQAPVVSDQNIITANGPTAATQFADIIVQTLKNKLSLS